MDLIPDPTAKPVIIGITDVTVAYSNGDVAKINFKTPMPVKPMTGDILVKPVIDGKPGY